MRHSFTEQGLFVNVKEAVDLFRDLYPPLLPLLLYDNAKCHSGFVLLTQDFWPRISQHFHEHSNHQRAGIGVGIKNFEKEKMKRGREGSIACIFQGNLISVHVLGHQQGAGLADTVAVTLWMFCDCRWLYHTIFLLWEPIGKFFLWFSTRNSYSFPV